MTTTTHQRHHSHTPVFLGQQTQYVFPASKALSQSTATLPRRPASSSALHPPSSTFSMPASARSDGSITPVGSPTTFSFPMKPSTPRSAVVNLADAPQHYPVSPPLTPNPPHISLGERRGHTRRQSEIIGGKSSLNSGGGLSPGFTFAGSRSGTSSPVKGGLSPVLSPTSSNILSPPSLAPLERGTAAPTPLGVPRRGHAHRRSQAMSSGDVMSLMLSQAKSKQTPGSAPSSPLEEKRSASFEGLNTPSERPSMEASTPRSLASSPISPIESSAASSRKSSTESLPRRNRVTFIDAPEIIPRPASAGTMSTTRTARNGDSVSSMASFAPSVNSVVIDLDDAIPQSFGGRRASASDAHPYFSDVPRTTARRPNSADASTILNAASKPSWLFPPLSPKDKEGAPKKPKTSKKAKKAHKKALSESGSSAMKAAKKSLKVPSPDGVAGSKKYKGGMKGWAGSILLRRHYQKQQMRGLPRRSPTPPLMQRDEIQRLMTGGSYVVLPPKAPMPRHRSVPSLEDYEPIIDLGIYDEDDDKDLEMQTESQYPVIDLDAALGPFNTPASPQAKTTGFGVARHRMHSFNGVYHKRAESMPEMQLFSLEEDAENDGMGDVFEDSEEDDEDEEDEEEEEEHDEGDDTIIADQDGREWNEPLGMEWSANNGDEREELDQLDGITTVRKGLKRKMSLVTEEDPSKIDGDSHFTFAPVNMISSASLPVSPSDRSQLSPSKPAFLTPIGTSSESFQSLTSTATSMSPSYVASTEPPSSCTTPTTTSDFGYPLPSPPLSQTEFLFPPPRTSSVYDDDRSTVVSTASFYDDPMTLGEPGPEMRMSISIDDIPSTSTYAASTSALSFYPHLTSASVSAATMPGIISGERRGSGSMAGRTDKNKKDKRWSKVFSFWKKEHIK